MELKEYVEDRKQAGVKNEGYLWDVKGGLLRNVLGLQAGTLLFLLGAANDSAIESIGLLGALLRLQLMNIMNIKVEVRFSVTETKGET